MFLTNGAYDAGQHHDSYLSVGVPGTVAGLHLAWKEQGRLPWRRLVEPAIALARDGFVLSESLAGSLRRVLPSMQVPGIGGAVLEERRAVRAGERFVQRDLARTLERIASEVRPGFYDGETAALIAQDMAAHGGLITKADLQA